MALLQDFLLNEQAFAFARETLRGQYARQVEPASYDHVVESLRLTRSDLLEYYRTVRGGRESSLSAFVSNLLRERARSWVHNVKEPSLSDALILDFYKCYERFFLTRDTSLATLHLVDLADDVIGSIAEMRSELHAVTKRDAQDGTDGFAEEVLATLLLLEVNFDVTDKRSGGIDVLITEPATLVPIRTLLSAQVKEATESDVDFAVDRARRREDVGRIILVTPSAPAMAVSKYAERRSVLAISFGDLRDRLSKRERNAVYILGRAASKALASQYHVDEVYIDPDAVPVSTNRVPQFIESEPRTPLRSLFEQFLEDPAQRILLVLGDYGHGKSAWSARMTHELAQGGNGIIPVYMPLRHIVNPSDLVSVVDRGLQLASSLGNHSARRLAILDGLDELPNAMDPAEKRKNVYRVLEASGSADKLVITARSSYFRGLSDFWELFDASEAPGLWSRMAAHIPSGKHRPRISAVMLHPFNNAQIDTYIERTSETQGRPAEFAEQFLARMKENDPHDVYRRLARNPLYLFLFIMTEPWLDASVRCSADIVAVLIKYWLERDLEKGQSRWLLRTQDRLEFMAALAWHMFERDLASISFQEFEEFVWAFYKFSQKTPENSMVLLDLQTTGLFGCSGGSVYFALPAVLDYCVAEAFWEELFTGPTAWVDPAPPARPPSTEQARLWLGMIETRPSRKSDFWISQNAVQWCEQHGIVVPRVGSEEAPISISPAGILYGNQATGEPWPVANVRTQGVLRAVLNHALSSPATAIPNQLRVRIANRYGLHARPSAEVCKAAMEMLAGVGSGSDAKLEIRYNGLIGSATSMMHVMRLCAERGAVVQFVYSGCARDDVEQMFRRLGGIRSDGVEHDWELSFWE